MIRFRKALLLLIVFRCRVTSFATDVSCLPDTIAAVTLLVNENRITMLLYVTLCLPSPRPFRHAFAWLPASFVERLRLSSR